MRKEITIETDFIKLDQLIKYLGVIQTGGQGKMMIQNGEVKVNGETAYERGKKIRSGDEVEIENVGVFVIK